jgi:IS605 OrfB family transposase
MYFGKTTLRIKDSYSKKRAELQAKGTRSAKRRLRSISGRERRFIKDVNHCIANSIVEEHSIIGIEDLTNIRENTETKSNKKHSKKKKDANRRKSQWSFFDLQGSIAYKSYMKSSLPVFVDPYKTSQQCPKCGFADSGNRKNKGEEFVCLHCSYSADADFIGGLNIGLRAKYVKEVFSGHLSIVPSVSDVEVKAWFRLRFQELRF